MSADDQALGNSISHRDRAVARLFQKLCYVVGSQAQNVANHLSIGGVDNASALLGWSFARAVVHRHDGPPNPEKLSWSLYATGDGARLEFFKSF